MIIKGGHNIYPAEIEELVGAVEGVRKGCVVAFGTGDPVQGTEKIVIVAETRERDRDVRRAITGAIVEGTAARLGTSPDEVILADPKTIPKTSSGKLKRSACKKMYLEGKISKGTAPVPIQLSKLFVTGTAKKTGLWGKAVVRAVYSAYAYAVFALVTVPFTAAMLLAPEKSARRICRNWARSALFFSGLFVSVRGKENLAGASASVYAANHASYLDFLALLAVLPDDVLYIAKKEFLDTPVVGTVIRKLGYLPVDRFDAEQRLRIAGKIRESLERGMSIMIFPEGTFTFAMGLRPFKTGAFKAAAESSSPVLPVSLKGTRSMLRDGSWLLRPGIIRVTISPPVEPGGNGWEDVIRLRNIVREEISRHCGEAPIDLVRAGWDREE